MESKNNYKRIRIFDSSFTLKSASVGGDNANARPTHFTWERNGRRTDPTFFTDSHLRDVTKFEIPPLTGGPKHVAWLLEPTPLHPENYEMLEIEYMGFYDAVLTYDRELIKRNPWCMLYLYGGSWIKKENWGVYPKNSGVSIIASDKNTLPGHKLRNEIIELFDGLFDGVYGYGRDPIETKIEGLAPFRFSVVIESCKFDYYFTEKLIDCLAVGTVPIYWGCPSIGDYFELDGIIQFDDIEELAQILSHLSKSDYARRIGAIKHNLIKARKHAVVEDWIFENHRELFE